MRLLNVFTLQLQEFHGGGIPTYAILSHTWEEEEVTYQDLTFGAYTSKKGFIKIRACCSQAINDGYDWVWVDTCCIDKTSSAELSEAINSMFHWYSGAVVCYVFLSDLPAQAPCGLDTQSFLNCRWFTRGWTLQELLAPFVVEFYDQGWNEIGTKTSLGHFIHINTGIQRDILAGRLSLFSTSIVERMSWASSRNTSRVEDIAYSLLGIFDINMPLLYGEGKQAFSRLQQEILRKSEDLSLLLWRSTSEDFAVLAQTPAAFRNLEFQTEEGQPVLALQRACELIRPLGRQEPFTLGEVLAGDYAAAESIHPPTITSRGLRASLPLITEGLYACAVVFGRIAAPPYDLNGYLCISLCDAHLLSGTTSSRVRSSPNSLFYKPRNKRIEHSPELYMRLETPRNTWVARVSNPDFRVVLDQKSPYALRICQLTSSIGQLLDQSRPTDMLRYHMKPYDSGIVHIQLISKPWITQREGPEVYQALVGIRSGKHNRLSCRTSMDESTLDWVLSRNNTDDSRDLTATWHQRNKWSDRSHTVFPDRKHVLSAAIKDTSTYPVLVLSVHLWKGAHAEGLNVT
ncbi:HET domain-containing protein [Colletotrichum scovillei]|uniref:HET-domain-containing protein n=1 Tax=Colletotrichum scovillei TaxID=1209932 RepID=A0A9P7QWE6_9PEZI|nr:HET domain-containing protein [Colletotrichum scovillei]KAF4784843.1 HET domain-containing protein [Colletotrichum scovillei]KAG7040153.1 HET-domain-containing protein [Colletotrichum scovillei]KAG7042303.1 HET-domain-containing protein [Colletotrichum scovillei]KAG7062337.1 HET-domain-containing protein [Colletotrichum scovillei]